MDMILVSARPRGARPHPRREGVATLAATLAAAGHRVRWLCPEPPGAAAPPPAAPPGVELRVTRTPPEGFAAVQDRLYDVPLEIALAEALRGDPPDIVHVDGYGGVSTYMSTWLSDRMGVSTVVVAAPRVDLLCHRGTLIDETGAPCTRWSEPARCFACCTTAVASVPEGLDPPGHGPSPARAFWARVTRALGPLSVAPRQVDFENRVDIIVHGLDVADLVLFEDAAARDDLVALQLPERGLRVGVPAATDAAGWVQVYAEAQRRHAGA